MREFKEPGPALLIAGLIVSQQVKPENAVEGVASFLGARPMEVSPVKSFDFTDYYVPEMGQGLRRVFVVLDLLVGQDELVRVKHLARRFEQSHLTASGGRRINVDPGLLTPERLVLASSKDFTHRVYLGEGVFADLTLVYSKGSYRGLPWTYPDYLADWSLAFWNGVRPKLLERRKAWSKGAGDSRGKALAP